MHLCKLCKYFVFKKFICICRLNGMFYIIDGYTNAFAAFAHAEFAGQFDLITQLMFFHQFLETFNNRFGTQQVAGAAHANGNLHILIPPDRKNRYYYAS